MIVHTHKAVLARIEKFCDDYRTFGDAARAAGTSDAQLSAARKGTIPVPPSLLQAIGIERVRLYAELNDEHEKYGVTA